MAKMKVRIGLTPLGAIAVDERGGIVDKVLFKDAAGAFIATGGGTAELDMLEGSLRKSGHQQIEKSSIDGLSVARQLGMRDDEFFALSKKVAEAFTKNKMKEAVGRDYLIVQTVGCLDDLNHSINTLVTRLREWWGLHLPEMSAKFEDHEKYMGAVLSGEKIEDSMGMALGPQDTSEVGEYARMIEGLYAYRNRLEKYIEALMKETAPNVSSIAGPILGARLIAKAGTLDRLASFPSSTIQVLGAEKALFKHIVKGTPPPKHGMLLQHPLVSSAGQNERGRVARILAAKLAIAARVDRFSHGKGKLSIIKESLDKRLNSMKSGSSRRKTAKNG